MSESFNRSFLVPDTPNVETLYTSPPKMRSLFKIAGIIPKSCSGIEYILAGESVIMPDSLEPDLEITLEPGQHIKVKALPQAKERRIQVYGFVEPDLGNCGMDMKSFRDYKPPVAEEIYIANNCPEDVIHTVVFLDHEGNHIKTQQIPHGEEARAPATPKVPGLEFWKWDKDFDNIMDDTVVKAIYDQFTGPIFDIRFETSEQHIHVATMRANMGSGIDEPPEPPVIPGFRFTRWEGEWRKVLQDELVIGVYDDMCEDDDDDCCC